MSSEASLLRLLRTSLESCASIAQPPAQLLSRSNPSPNTVRSGNLSKSTLAHDAVTAAVSHKHHSIICVGAGLIRSHSRLAADLILQFFPASSTLALALQSYSTLSKDKPLQRCSKFALVPVFYPSAKIHSCVLLSSYPLSPLMDPKSPNHPDTRTTHVSSMQDYICDFWCLSVH